MKKTPDPYDRGDLPDGELAGRRAFPVMFVSDTADTLERVHALVRKRP